MLLPMTLEKQYQLISALLLLLKGSMEKDLGMANSMANSVDLDQTAPKSSLIKVYTVFQDTSADMLSFQN